MSGGVPAGELLPCPFCGGVDGDLVQAFTRASDDFAFWSVECLSCGAEIADDESQEAADRHWNTRATPTPPSRDADLERVLTVLRNLEAACDNLAANRSQETYLRMIDCDLATPYLDALDDARRDARAPLQALGERG